MPPADCSDGAPYPALPRRPVPGPAATPDWPSQVPAPGVHPYYLIDRRDACPTLKLQQKPPAVVDELPLLGRGRLPFLGLRVPVVHLLVHPPTHVIIHELQLVRGTKLRRLRDKLLQPILAVPDVRALAASLLLAGGGLRLDLLPPRIDHRFAALRAATTYVAGEVIAAVFARRRRRPSGLAIPEPRRRGEEQ